MFCIRLAKKNPNALNFNTSYLKTHILKLFKHLQIKHMDIVCHWLKFQIIISNSFYIRPKSKLEMLKSSAGFFGRPDTFEITERSSPVCNMTPR